MVSVLAALPVQIGEALVHVKKHAWRLLTEEATLQRVAFRAHGADSTCARISTTAPQMWTVATRMRGQELHLQP